jgi:hypothetical protein
LEELSKTAAKELEKECNVLKIKSSDMDHKYMEHVHCTFYLIHVSVDSGTAVLS